MNKKKGLSFEGMYQCFVWKIL